MDWNRRLREWITLLRHERGIGQPIPWMKMLRGIASPVPRTVWRKRIRTCHSCPLFDKERLACRCVMGPLAGIGCGCYVVFSALAPSPYSGEHTNGCYGRALFNDGFGWPEYAFPSKWDKWTALIRFLFRR